MASDTGRVSIGPVDEEMLDECSELSGDLGNFLLESGYDRKKLNKIMYLMGIGTSWSSSDGVEISRSVFELIEAGGGPRYDA